MKKRLGLVQTRGIGDIVIALPIADHYETLGYEIVWPIDEAYVSAFRRIKPSIKFLPVAKGDGFFLNDPIRLINEHECERTVVLYSYLSSAAVYDPRLSHSLKFDEYKYAIAGVPFSKKWELNIERDQIREQNLFDFLAIDGEYVCFHGHPSEMATPLRLPEHMGGGRRVVEIAPHTDSPFDWLTVLERAATLILVDSCFANVVEQLNFLNEKTVILHSPALFTPVFKNDWQFLFADAFRGE